MSTPSLELAKIILDKLVEEKILMADDAGRMKERLAEGKLTGEDWRLAIEKAVEKEPVDE